MLQILKFQVVPQIQKSQAVEVLNIKKNPSTNQRRPLMLVSSTEIQQHSIRLQKPTTVKYDARWSNSQR